MSARQHELNIRIISSLWDILMRFCNMLAHGLFPVVALYAYTYLAGNTLRIDIIFPALELFNALERSLRRIPDLIRTVLNAYIALGRIEDFMNEPDKEETNVIPSVAAAQLLLEDASFAWPGTSKTVLRNLNVSFPPGLNVVYGKVGAGKSALLQALLGELDRVGGTYHRPYEMIGYCAQTPWLQSMSIRDNILFSAPFEKDRYKRVLEACALMPDLATFKHGDLSNIGENGIGLSGGQKARVALARAVYSRSRILLLDDPLSALDHQTAELIVLRLLSGPLTVDRTVVLVTHRTELCRHLAEQVVEISEDGEARISGRLALEDLSPNQSPSTTPPPEPAVNANTIDDGTDEQQESAAVPDKFIEDEHRAEWGVRAIVYWKYIRAGKLRHWAILLCVVGTSRVLNVGISWFLKTWGEAYDEGASAIAYLGETGTMLTTSSLFTPPRNASTLATNTIGPIDKFPPPEEDVRPWLLGFLTLVTIRAVLSFTTQVTMLVIIYTAGKQLFKEVMIKVTHAAFRFYDVTPVGRLMNRLTSDIGTVDGNISAHFYQITFQGITWVTSVVVIATVTPTFLVFSVVLTLLFVRVFLQFLPASQSLRRLEMVSLSPLMSNFGELVHGLATVRAFHAQERFQSRVIDVVDNFQKMDHFYWSVQGWLMYRYNMLSACSTFILTVLALYTNVSPGLTAFVLIAAENFVQSTNQLCKQYGQMQMDFVAVERIHELLQVEQEPPGDIDPPAAWPIFGSDIVFEDVTIRYAPHMDPALSNISLRIPGGSTTAIVGRTGSGKSTLALSLLSTVRPDIGRIMVDNIDIAHVNTEALRTRVTFVAQEPVLFDGTMRQNLDPLSQYTDEECAAVLHRICARHGWTLETHIEPGGRNLSQGQRQIIGLTRAVLRRSSIVILDEATASVDAQTSMEIQQILREEMQESTVITIAHRVEAVRNADFAIVLDKGRVAAQGPAADVLAARDGMPRDE